MEKIDIKSMTPEELRAELPDLPKFRVKQIFSWLHRGVVSFDEMTDISKELRAMLAERYEIACAQIILKRVSKDGTIKYLFQMNDGELIESVLMKYAHGYSICISTQVGCKMNCSFCATGKSGFSRDLLPSEMLSQVQEAQRDENIRISNIVLMGMGEPLDNYDNVLRFLELVSHPDGMNIGMRHISLSTCGLVDRIYDLAEKKLQLTLSISLHAPNDEIRNRTMPVNRRWNVEQLLAACRHYSRETGRRISFEYAMISGVNDSDQCAKELASRLHGMTAHVNLIPINNVTDTGYKRSDIARQKRFISILELGGCTATVRRTLGSDIEASCGQLSRKHKGGNGYEG
ncbi:23S rRNA (adenine(2503)-C(2))-methyltransferase RlmN [Acutalibacter sp. 1XD8-36]|uniref:23S rRNA (adenine(2503)-C(2))-methyltransferase RlmN n=1 Tax=Acutalibacter sp. 1XD8-36 TaxID=2320852 RepID=UPI001413140F|nr:23S rRNA (adenine(2503)-C(2))-methyltransferase RlmN [Acutalibacter sp. 1XD8-36]NBJ88036.1 23S rRNA (adenine(2503)-C(2))-methyltransferase RlmN [Acutalibacter sp. 1XD8-36]